MKRAAPPMNHAQTEMYRNPDWRAAYDERYAPVPGWGVNPNLAGPRMVGIGQPTDPSTSLGGAAFWLLDTASMAASTYHGYKRNDSIGWALWWGLCGALFPVVTPIIAVAQGFGKPATRRVQIGSTANRRRKHAR